jgi:mannosyltransferase OCH1-like enzyme
MSKIPHIIHQTWKNSDVPEYFTPVMDTWVTFNKGWTLKLWTDEMNRDFIAVHFPDFLSTYDNYPKAIQRVDAVRYFILKVYGGVYVDLDFECLKPIEKLLDGHQCVFGLEPLEHGERFNNQNIICNAFMAAVPGHQFINMLCQELTDQPFVKKSAVNIFEVLNTAGPMMLTRIHSAYKGTEPVCILPSKFLYPATLEEARSIASGQGISDLLNSKLEEAYALHYFWGSWIQSNMTQAQTIENT